MMLFAFKCAKENFKRNNSQILNYLLLGIYRRQVLLVYGISAFLLLQIIQIFFLLVFESFSEASASERAPDFNQFLFPLFQDGRAGCKGKLLRQQSLYPRQK